MLDYLKWMSLVGAGFALTAHLVSFAIAVNDNVLQVGLFSLAFLAAAGATLSFFPGDTETQGTAISLKDSALRYVPWWMQVPAGLTMLYFAIGLAYQAPGVDQFSVVDMTPVLARWACVADTLLFLIAAPLYHGSARIRERGSL